MKLRATLAALACTVLALFTAGCDEQSNQQQPPAAKSSQEIRIVAGSENESLEPLIQEFAKNNGVSIKVTYKGSVDIMLELEKGTGTDYDAVWPAHSMWIAQGDKQHVVKNIESIYRTPVVIAVKKTVAQNLGWIGKDVKVADILDAAQKGKLRFMMTSATQSNSGASAYIGYLQAFAGTQDVLTSADLQKASVRSKIKSILGRVNRTAGSSGWLKDLFLNQYDYFDAMVNYETMVIETNQELTRRGLDPLYVIYPSDGLTIADSPIGYVNKGDAAKEATVTKLQQFLKSDAIQRRLLSSGHRTGFGINVDGADPMVFNQSLGISTSIDKLPIVTMPSTEVLREALVLYQTAFRKPSLTVFVLDFSGSMGGSAEDQLKNAMRTLLDPTLSSKYLLQPSPEDVTIIIPFDGAPRSMWKVVGNDPAKLREAMNFVESNTASGGTDIYAPLVQGVGEIKKYPYENYSTAFILMTDGKSDGNIERFKQELVNQGVRVPVYSIMFGDAEPSQLKGLADHTSGRVFDGKKDLVDAFRKAKGYN